MAMTLSRKILFAVLTVFLCAGAYSMPVVVIEGESVDINLSSRVEFYRDSSGLGLNQVRNLPPDRWQTSAASELSFGFSNTNYWFRLRLKNDDSNDRAVLLWVDYASFDHIEMFEIRGSEVSLSVTGAKVPADSRIVKHRYPLLPVRLGKGESTDIYLRAANSGVFFFPLRLLDRETFQRLDNTELLALGAYFGIWLIVIACNLLLFIVLRHKALLILAGFILTLGLYQLSSYGLGAGYITGAPSIQDDIFVFSIGFAIISLGWLADSLLELGQRNPPARRLLRFIAGCAATFMVSYLFLPYRTVTSCLAVLTIPNAIVVLYAGVHAAVNRYRLGLYATLAWFTPLMGTIIDVLSRFSLIPTNAFTATAQETGFIVMILVLTVAIAAEIRRQTRLRGLMLLEQEQRASAREKERLEQMVGERTSELQEALRELSEVNATLQELTTVDALTGIKNRQYFDSTFDQEWRRATRESYPLSILLLDIDRFKNVNDTWGHLAGDECLRHIAAIMGSFLKRPADVLARYGGEEFVIILPYVKNQDAAYLAEQIRRSIESSEIPVDGNTMKVTISIGVCTITPEKGDEPTDLINAADMALYRAKSDGRNLVRNAGQLVDRGSKSTG